MKGKLAIDEDDDEMGQCMRCNMIQCISDQENAIMALKAQSGKVITLREFDKVHTTAPSCILQANVTEHTKTHRSK